MEVTTPRRKRSQKISKEQMASLRKYIRQFDCQYDAALEIGIVPSALSTILKRRSAAPDTINKINQAIAAKSAQQ